MKPPIVGRTGAAVAVGAVLALALAGCGAAKTSSAPASSAASTAAPSTAATPSVTSPTATLTTGSQLPAPQSGSMATAAPPANGEPSCVLGSLTVRAVRDSGAGQVQSATVQITNPAATACTLTGPPQIQLFAQGTPIGTPSTPAGSPTGTSLTPRATASSELSGPSTCNAPVSQIARVTLPGSSFFVDVPLTMRACPLQAGEFRVA